jgi:Chitobiase/beta-hexosaminidase C-terminal domain
MRISSFVILSACIFNYCNNAWAQAIGQSITLTNQSMQSVPNSGQQPNLINGSTAQQGSHSHATLQYSIIDAPKFVPDCHCAKEPVFPVKADNNLTLGTQVTITSPTNDAVIYYTTDGWTPTEASARYAGPITIKADTRLQAIAEEPGKLPSPIAEQIYTISGSPAPKPDRIAAAGGILTKGTPLRLVTYDDVSSDSAQVGDHIVVLLDENVMAGEAVAAPRGSPADVTITKVDPAGPDGKPGMIAFEVQALNVHGVHIPLSANLTLQAPYDAMQAQKNSSDAKADIEGEVKQDGDEAEIKPGMVVNAFVTADTPLRP